MAARRWSYPIVLLLVGLFACGKAGADVTLTPVEVSQLYAFADGIQSTGSGGYFGVGVFGEAEWDVLSDPSDAPTSSAEDDPIGPPDDGWCLDGVSSFAMAGSAMIDAGGWSTVDGNDTFQLSVIGQASQDPNGQYGPEGWGYEVSYLLITYATAPTGGSSPGDPMTVTLEVGLSGELFAAGPNDEYLLDLGYTLGTGLTDYDPVLENPANDPNPGLDQFTVYLSWRSTGNSYEQPTFADALESNGQIGDQVQVLIAMSSFAYSFWGYGYGAGTLDATVTAVAPASCPGDLDGDGVTGQSDLGILLADWGCTGDCAGDIDGDGATGQSDLGILLADWGCDVNP